jgi:hypothetical protein
MISVGSGDKNSEYHQLGFTASSNPQIKTIGESDFLSRATNSTEKLSQKA